MYKWVLTLACSIVMMAGALSAFADPIGPTCGGGNCLGDVYTLDYSQTSVQKGTDNYTITLTINSSGFVDGTDSGFLMAVSPNIPGWSAATLVSAPGGIDNWSVAFAGGLDSGGCNGHGTPFFCNDALFQGTFNEVGSSTPLQFVWTMTDSALPTGTDQAAIKALFDNSSGKNLGITSVDITLQPGGVTSTPEPASLFLVGSGLIGLAVFLKRRLSV